MPVLFIILLKTSPIDAGCLSCSRQKLLLCVFPVHACGFCSLQLASYPAGQHIHVKLLMLRLSSTWLVGTSMTYLFRYRPRHEVRQGVHAFSKITTLSILQSQFLLMCRHDQWRVFSLTSSCDLLITCEHACLLSYQQLSRHFPPWRCLWTSLVLIMQIMPERSEKLLLIVLCLLPCSVTAFECSLSAFTSEESPCQCICQNASNLFYHFSPECSIKQDVALFSLINISSLPLPVFIILDLAPLIVYFAVLIIFNIDLASGPAQSFLFFYHALSVVFETDFLWGFLTKQNPLNDLLSPRTLPYIALQHFKLLAVVMAIVMTMVLVKCIHCPCASWRHPWAKLRRSAQNFREKHAQKGTVLNGLCSIGILTYRFVIKQVFYVLRLSRCCPGGATYCSYYCTELEYGRADYRTTLIITAAVFSIALALLLPLLLLYYPCGPALMQRVTKRSPQFVTCHKLAPVLDVFQSAYKPKLRFFAALPLLYRFVIWFLFSTLSAVQRISDRLIVITFVFTVILAVHSLVQPYSKPKHNYIETLYLVNLVLISMMVLIGQLASSSPFLAKGARLAKLFAYPLVFLPMLVSVGYFFWKCKCCKRCRAVCCKRTERSRRGSAQSEDLQTTSSDVYFDMGEVGQMSKEDF